jgi:hypothetical protein
MNKTVSRALVAVLATPSIAGLLAASPVAPTAAQVQTVVGEVSTVEARNSTFSIKTKDQTESFTLGKNASVTSPSGKAVHLADLRVGERVEVRYTANGAARQASSVHVLSHPAKTS